MQGQKCKGHILMGTVPVQLACPVPLDADVRPVLGNAVEHWCSEEAAGTIGQKHISSLGFLFCLTGRGENFSEPRFLDL